MVRSTLWVLALATLVLHTTGCGDDAAGATAGGGSGASGGGSGLASGVGGGTSDSGSPHTPDSGCQSGFVECAGWCVDTTNDAYFCGGCDSDCFGQAGLTCSSGMCEPGECVGAQCGDECVTNRSTNADHCGSCFNQCATDGLCFDGGCVDGGGDGSDCTSPLFWNIDDEERVGFRFAPALTSEHTFPCGPLEPIPTRWFRFTANDTETGVEVRAEGPDDFIIEVFDGPGCGPSESLGCNDDASGTDPEFTAPTQSGGTYFVAVGLKGTWSGQSASIRADH